MNKELLLCIPVIFMLLLSISGCASSRAYQREEVERLKSRIAQLESEIELRDKKQHETQEAFGKKPAPAKAGDAAWKNQKGSRDTVNDTVRKIQLALKNAGYDPGSIDGKFGKKTKEAIVAFQKENGLVPDGVAGDKTWAKLRKYAQRIE